ncbi:MAG TPA: cupin domain-containing protein [Oscillospiraceae bacterium]|nr:cupin domain-containing protein [Oscillospiraceae bacterium]
MADKFIKNMDVATVLPLAEQVSYQQGQIVSKTLAQNKALSLTLFAFDKGEEISTHASDGDAMVIALDGTGEITIDEEKFTLHAGETIVMPAKKPHAVFASEQFKMFLIVVFPQ